MSFFSRMNIYKIKQIFFFLWACGLAATQKDRAFLVADVPHMTTPLQAAASSDCTGGTNTLRSAE